MELLHSLGIDWRLFIAQLITFLVLLTVLTFVLFKPLVAMLEKRRERITTSLKDAERIGAELSSRTRETTKIIADSREQAARIVSEAQKEAEHIHRDAVEKTKAEVASVIAAGRNQVIAEREASIAAVRAAAAELITIGIEKVIGEKFTGVKDREFIKKQIDTL